MVVAEPRAPRARRERSSGALLAYVALAFALSWAWWVPLAVTGRTVRAGQGWPTHLIGLTGPALAAVLVTGVSDGRAGLVTLGRRAIRWRVGLRWWLLVAATFALGGLGLLAGLLEGGEPASLRELGRYSGAPSAARVPLLLVVAAYVIVIGGIGEEFGWRGFLAERLLRRCGRLRTATVVWVVWAAWHAPLFWVVESYRGFAVPTVAGWLVGLWFGSYFLTWLYESSGGSVLIVALWHTAYNLATATEAGSGVPAAVATVLVVGVTVSLLVRSRATGRPTPRKHHPGGR